MRELIKVCPECGSEDIYFSNKQKTNICEDCGAKFDRPVLKEGYQSEKTSLMQMVSEEPPVDLRTVKAFLASSTVLENERSAVTTEIARLNGQDMSFYINMYHCEHDDGILTDSTQQEEYNKKIDECDLFLLLIDNSEIGDITLGEVMRGAEAGKRLAAFVRKGTPDGGERNIRWEKFIERNKDKFCFYREYTTFGDIETNTDELYDYVKDLGDRIGTLTEKCSRYTYDICLTGTDGCSDEFIYAIGDKFNAINNKLFEEDELCSLVFRLNIVEPVKDIPDETIDYYFIVRRKNENMIQMIKGCYDKADPVMFLDVNVFDNGNRDAVWETVSAISSEIRDNYVAEFATREKLMSKRSFDNRVGVVRERYSDLLKGLSEYRRGNYFDAVKYLDRAAEYHFVSAYFHLGVIYADKEHDFYDEQKAMEYWCKAADKGNDWAQVNLGNMLHDSGRTKEAEKYFRMAVDNGCTYALNNLGELLYESGRTKEAEKYFRMAVDNGDTSALNNLGMLLYTSGRVKEAEKYFRMAVDNGDTSALNNLGMLLYTSGRIKEAEKCYRLAAENGDTSAALNNLGVVFYTSDRTKDAEKYWRMSADNGDSTAQLNLGNILDDSGRKKEAEKYYRLAADNGFALAQYNLGILLEKLGRTEEAEKYWRMAADNGNSNAQFHFGGLLADSGRTEEAEKYYRLAADNGHTSAQNNLGVLLNNSGRTKEAEMYYRMAADNGETKAQCNLGFLLDNSGKTEEAEKYYRMAADNGMTEAQHNLGVLLYEEKGDTHGSEKYLLMAAKNGDVEAMFNLGYLYEHTDRPSEAEKYYLKALEKGYEDAKEALDRLKNGK